jgi:site-specific recombinase XerD
MKTTDFAVCLTDFLKIYLPGKRELSTNTIMSYRDTFRFWLIFAEEKMNISAEKMTLADFNEDSVLMFLRWLKEERKNCASTRKQRLAAIHVFIDFLKTRKPEYLLEYQKILSLKIKEQGEHNISYLSPETVKEILAAPNLREHYGQRDMVLLALMYDSAARVQEICDLTVGNIRLQKPATVTITGKGQKTRVVPIMSETADAIALYLKANNLNLPEKREYPLFFNHMNTKLTRAGVTYILKKYCDAVRTKIPTLPKISPHMFRHSKAMHMLKAGTNLVYIRDFLGHAGIATTEIYAKADTETKREVIEKLSPKLTSDLTDWREDTSLMSMLSDLCR